jgi:hypothetical protein
MPKEKRRHRGCDDGAREATGCLGQTLIVTVSVPLDVSAVT